GRADLQRTATVHFEKRRRGPTRSLADPSQEAGAVILAPGLFVFWGRSRAAHAPWKPRFWGARFAARHAHLLLINNRGRTNDARRDHSSHRRWLDGYLNYFTDCLCVIHFGSNDDARMAE